MNWTWVGVAALLLLGALEFLRRGETNVGRLVGERLKTFSARATVAFLCAFALVLPFSRIGIGLAQRLVLIGLLIGLVIANFIHLDNREA